MKNLVINCGSSSLKYQLINMENEAVLASGLVERIGIEGSTLTHKVPGADKYIVKNYLNDHKEAVQLVLDTLVDKEHGVIENMSEISAVGHRIVHGGKYSNSELVTDKVVEDLLNECTKLAPLHTIPNVTGIKACKALMPNTPMVVVFDTSFYQTLPEYAYTYALPYELCKEHRIRKYGFHGTSHKYVSKVAREMLGDENASKIVTCHLGNGSSVSAVKDGVCLDTSMGFTPLAGVPMGTRCGNIDPAILVYLSGELKMNADEINTLMNKKSGVLGVSGISSDFRDIESAAAEGNKRAQLALDIFNYNVKKVIGAYAAVMNGIDCLVFTAGVGENAAVNRKEICSGLQFLGIEIDDDKNNTRGTVDITGSNSKVKVLVIPTNEELMIARETKEIVENL